MKPPEHPLNQSGAPTEEMVAKIRNNGTRILPVLAVTQKEAIIIICSQKIFRRALHHGWIKPVIQGGRGKASLFNFEDVRALWARIDAGEEPPLLPCESKGVLRFFTNILDMLKGGEKGERICSPAVLDKMAAEKYAEAEREREDERLAAEKAKLDAKVVESSDSEQEIKIEIDL